MLNNFHWHCHAHGPTRPRPGLHCPYTQSASRPSRKFCSAPSGEKFCILIRPAMPALIKCQQIKGELSLPLRPAFPSPLPPAPLCQLLPGYPLLLRGSIQCWIVEESLIDVCQSGILLSFGHSGRGNVCICVCVCVFVCACMCVIIMGHVKPAAIVCDDKW